MDDAWRHIFHYFSTLERIRYERVSARWMKLLREHWKQLDTVDTDTLCIDVRLDHWSSCVQAVLVRCSSQITSFNFGRDRQETCRRGTKKHLLPDVLIELAEKTPSLRSFRVEDCFFCSDTVALLQKLPSTLKVFCLERCIIDCSDPHFVTTCLLSLLDNCTALEEFVITGHNSCYGYLHIDDDFMEHIPPTVSILCISAGEALKIRNANFVFQLEKLRIFDAQCSFLSFESLQDLVCNAPNLLYLDLSNSLFIADFSPIGKLSKLRCLLLNDNHIHLKNAQLTAIIEGCTSLEVLSLERCTKLSNEDLKVISKCATLKELHLAGVIGMTDDALTCIAFAISLLRVLDISYCKSLTAKGLESLAMLQKLDHLCANGIYDFDSNLVNMIRKYRPHCVIEAFHCRYTMSTSELFQM
uniref:F-box/LRR-repeat protein 20 n=1 Tax=Elaeophora elaphi TaxID=1147741 RepID=A0A0R3RZ05_9BILA